MGWFRKATSLKPTRLRTWPNAAFARGYTDCWYGRPFHNQEMGLDAECEYERGWLAAQQRVAIKTPAQKQEQHTMFKKITAYQLPDGTVATSKVDAVEKVLVKDLAHNVDQTEGDVAPHISWLIRRRKYVMDLLAAIDLPEAVDDTPSPGKIVYRNTGE